MKTDTFATRLRFLMTREGLSGYALAKRSGLSESTISPFVLGQRLPTLPSLLAIAKALNVSLAEFDGVENNSGKSGK